LKWFLDEAQGHDGEQVRTDIEEIRECAAYAQGDSSEHRAEQEGQVECSLLLPCRLTHV